MTSTPSRSPTGARCASLLLAVVRLLFCFVAAVASGFSVESVQGQDSAWGEAVIRVGRDNPDGSRSLGNGVIIASDDDGVTILTAQHVARGGVRHFLLTESGRRIEAQVWIEHPDSDVAVFVSGARSNRTPVPIDNRTPDPGEQLWIVSHWPQGDGTTRFTTVPVMRGQTQYQDGFTVNRSTIPGVSGSPVFSRRGVVGVISCTDNPRNESIVAPLASIMRARELQEVVQCYGGQCYPYPQQFPRARLVVPRQSIPLQPALRPISPTPAPQPVGPDYGPRITKIEQTINQLSVTVNQLSGSTVNRSDLQRLQAELQQAQKELEQLRPLLRREVILVSDGEVTARRNLKPSDPIVLGSEIVIRRPQSGKE